jgi:hypothetical protein
LSAGIGVACAAFAASAVALGATPDASQMVLRASDLPSAKVSSHATTPATGFVSGYEREFALAKPYGRSKFQYVSSSVDVAGETETAQDGMQLVRTLLRTPKVREDVAKEIVKRVGGGFKRKDLTLGKLRTPAIGDEAVELPLTMNVTQKVKGKTLRMRVYSTLTFFRIDRALATLETTGLAAAAANELVALGSLVVAHSGLQLVPFADAPPTISGSAQQGQSLTAASGRWSNTPALAFQWQRCDAAGAACVDLVGATGANYAVTAADAGATLRVVEKGTNRFGAATGVSVQTAVVT